MVFAFVVFLQLKKIICQRKMKEIYTDKKLIVIKKEKYLKEKKLRLNVKKI